MEKFAIECIPPLGDFTKVQCAFFKRRGAPMFEFFIDGICINVSTHVEEDGEFVIGCGRTACITVLGELHDGRQGILHESGGAG